MKRFCDNKPMKGAGDDQFTFYYFLDDRFPRVGGKNDVWISLKEIPLRYVWNDDVIPYQVLFKFRKKERKKEGRVSINFGTRNAHFQEKAASKRASHCADIKRAKVIIGGVHVLAIHAASPDAITIACKMKNGTNGKQFFLGRHHFLDSATGGHSLDQSRGERITEIA